MIRKIVEKEWNKYCDNNFSIPILENLKFRFTKRDYVWFIYPVKKKKKNNKSGEGREIEREIGRIHSSLWDIYIRV